MSTKTFLSLLFPAVVLLFWTGSPDWPETNLSRATPQAHIAYLASDELRGREAGAPGADLAAAYIADQFKKYGLAEIPGAPSYLQAVPLAVASAPVSATIVVDGQTFTQGKDLLVLNGQPMEVQTTLVFAGYGWVDEETKYDDYAGLDVKGKLVLTIAGTPTDSGMRAAFGTLADKQKWAAERGALGVVQLYQLRFPWSSLVRRYQGERLDLVESPGDEPGFSAWLQGAPDDLLKRLRAGEEASVTASSSGFSRRLVGAANVAGLAPGSDPALKDEYLLLTAHYDHVGVGSPDARQDSIYNGARDNAMGVAALLAAAETLALKPPKRSVIFLAVTAEEKGLLGSRYYADHPLIPLEKTVFNLNSDGGGYNDTTAVSAIGYGRTGTDATIDAAVRLAGLATVIPNPEPQQNFFDRSDNVSFARKGMPCMTVSPGFAEFNEAIQQYYHRPADEANSLDYDYVLRFCKVFAHAARLIADNPNRPQWTAGDPYEEAGRKLYGER